MARESDPSGGVTPIPKWFLAIVALLAVPIAGGALAVYIQLTQLSERMAAQQTQLARVEAALTSTAAELRETARTTALQSQAQSQQGERAGRIERELEGVGVRVRELERVCLPRR